jgi:hypothetical protein
MLCVSLGREHIAKCMTCATELGIISSAVLGYVRMSWEANIKLLVVIGEHTMLCD